VGVASLCPRLNSNRRYRDAISNQNGSPPSEGGVAAASADGVVLFQTQTQIPNPKSQIKTAPLLPKEGWQPLRLTGWFSSKSQIPNASATLPTGRVSAYSALQFQIPNARVTLPTGRVSAYSALQSQTQFPISKSQFPNPNSQFPNPNPNPKSQIPNPKSLHSHSIVLGGLDEMS
jgi:hypothetical protein